MLIYSFFNLRGVDVLRAGYNHVVFASTDSDNQIFVPDSRVAGIHPALVEFFGSHFWVLDVGVGRLFRGADYDFPLALAVGGNCFLWLGLFAFIDFYDPDFIVCAAASDGTGSVREIVRTEK